MSESIASVEFKAPFVPWIEEIMKENPENPLKPIFEYLPSELVQFAGHSSGFKVGTAIFLYRLANNKTGTIYEGVIPRFYPGTKESKNMSARVRILGKRGAVKAVGERGKRKVPVFPYDDFKAILNANPRALAKVPLGLFLVDALRKIAARRNKPACRSKPQESDERNVGKVDRIKIRRFRRIVCDLYTALDPNTNISLLDPLARELLYSSGALLAFEIAYGLVPEEIIGKAIRYENMYSLNLSWGSDPSPDDAIGLDDQEGLNQGSNNRDKVVPDSSPRAEESTDTTQDKVLLQGVEKAENEEHPDSHLTEPLISNEEKRSTDGRQDSTKGKILVEMPTLVTDREEGENKTQGKEIPGDTSRIKQQSDNEKGPRTIRVNRLGKLLLVAMFVAALGAGAMYLAGPDELAKLRNSLGFHEVNKLAFDITDPKSVRERVHNLSADGRFQDTISLSRKLIGMDTASEGDHATANYYLGVASHSLGLFAEAEAYLLLAEIFYKKKGWLPNLYPVLLEKALTKFRLGETAAAESILDDAWDIFSKIPNGGKSLLSHWYELKIMLLISQNRRKAALSLARELSTRLDPEDLPRLASCYNWIAVCYSLNGSPRAGRYYRFQGAVRVPSEPR